MIEVATQSRWDQERTLVFDLVRSGYLKDKRIERRPAPETSALWSPNGVPAEVFEDLERGPAEHIVAGVAASETAGAPS